MSARLESLPVVVWKETTARKPGEWIDPLPGDDEIIVAGEDIPVNYFWKGRDVREFIRMWEEGLSLQDIARAWPGRNPDDVIDLWRHCLYKRWITDRPGGIYGRRRRLKDPDAMEILVRRDDQKWWRVGTVQQMFGRNFIAFLPERFKTREEAERFAAQLKDERRRLA